MKRTKETVDLLVEKLVLKSERDKEVEQENKVSQGWSYEEVKAEFDDFFQK